MVARKHFGGDRDTAVDYLGIGRNLLDQLLAGMRLNGLQVLSRTVGLPGGVTITVSSVFGQHDIRIEAPPGAVQAQDAVQQVAEQLREVPAFGVLRDVVKVSGTIKLTLTSTDYTESFNPDPSSSDATTSGDNIAVGLRDHILVAGSITVTLVTGTYPSWTPPPVPPQIFIGGQTSKGQDAFVWDDINGYTPLNLGNSAQRKNGQVLGFSPDGSVIVGQLQSLQSGSFYTIAAKWQTRNNEAQIPNYNASTGVMQTALQASNDGGTILGGGVAAAGNKVSPFHFKWDGQNGHSAAIEAGAATQQGLTSPNGRLKVNGQKYQIDGGPWINWGPNSPVLASGVRQAPSDAVAFGVMHNPYTAPTAPQPTYTTTVLVFSA
jgi:hypothetical protein